MRIVRMLIVLVVVLLSVPPVVGVLVALGGGADALAWADLVPRPVLLVQSLGWACGIAMLATTLGWIAAWCVRGHGGHGGHGHHGHHGIALAGIMLTPLLLPSYLAYHSMGMHRAPLTKLGDVIERMASPVVLGGWGLEWLPVFVGRAIAITGLSLWVWPVAMLMLLPAVLRVDGAMLDAARSQGAGRWRVQRMMLRAERGAIMRCVLLVTVLMLGSSVPLHLAQAPTYSIVAWQSIVLNPRSMSPWLASWPLLVLVMGLVAVFVMLQARARREALAGGRTSVRLDEPGAWFERGSRKVRWTNVLALCLLGVSVVVPLVSYAISVQRWSSVTNFWRVSQDAVIMSAGVAACVGLAGVLVLVGAWMLVGNTDAPSKQPNNRARPWKSAVWIAGLVLLAVPALLPGIMVGHAWSIVGLLAERWAGSLDVGLGWGVVSGMGSGIRDSSLLVVLAHTSRLALLLVLLGAWMAMSEEPALRDARRLAGGDGSGGGSGRGGRGGDWRAIRAWSRAELARSWGVVVGVGLACACLSLHEIESSIVLQPVGTSSLAQTMLAQLHFARQEEIAAAAVLVLTPAALVAMLAGLLLARHARR